jgi:ElaB/YqjD/DUF883 family membrane-anchored ribosome-binding protein
VFTLKTPFKAHDHFSIAQLLHPSRAADREPDPEVGRCRHRPWRGGNFGRHVRQRTDADAASADAAGLARHSVRQTVHKRPRLNLVVTRRPRQTRRGNNPHPEGQQTMNTPYENIGNKAKDVLDTAARSASAVGHDVEHAAHKAVDAVAHSAAQVRDQASHWRDASAGYVREHPMQTVLVAAGVGAALALLTSALTRRSDHRN